MVREGAGKGEQQSLNREELLQLGIQTARAGNKQSARVIFQQVLNGDPRNERALLWMAATAWGYGARFWRAGGGRHCAANLPGDPGPGAAEPGGLLIGRSGVSLPRQVGPGFLTHWNWRRSDCRGTARPAP